ncbi:MAG TPA: nitroreductase family protein [Janthinobacterium sp.]|nr:nitroreductase family protein [Janthinobacterium sp.]
MNDTMKTLIEARISVNHYDTTRDISDEQLAELVRLSTLAPSAYNFQNWKFIAIRTVDAKARLKTVCYGQQKVVDAAVTYIICGKLAAHKGLPDALRPSVEAGMLNQSVYESWIAAACRAHEGNEQLQRDEAMRSASLAAMTLMLAAQGMGLSSGSMSGFDASALAQEFGLAPDELPVILVTVGYTTEGNWPQKLRKPVHEVLTFA